MGNPVLNVPNRASEANTSTSCPGIRLARRVERNPFRRRPTQSWVEPTEPYTEDWSAWTRNIRQRAEILHTDPPIDGPSRPPGEEASRDDFSAFRRDQRFSSGPPAAASEKEEEKPKHRYSLRLGYDPRVFLEDPALRGQRLTPEAQEWAASYRSRIPMTSDIQLARRLEPEIGRAASNSHTASQRRPSAHIPILSIESSDDDIVAVEPLPMGSGRPGAGNEQTPADNPAASPLIARRHLQHRLWRAAANRAHRAPDSVPVRLSLLQQLASSDSPFRTADSNERLNMLGEALSAATWELSNASRGMSAARERERFEGPAIGETMPAASRERGGLHRERLEELERLLHEGPSVLHRRLAAQYTDRQEENAA